MAAIAMPFLLPNCSKEKENEKENEKDAPLKSQMESTVKASIPAFLSMSKLETEVITVAQNRVEINFKANVSSSEPLYIEDGSLTHYTGPKILKESQSAGTETILYGSMLAERMMDKWEISHPTIDSGHDQIGRPRGSFGVNYVVEGSDEMNQLLADQKVERAKEKKLWPLKRLHTALLGYTVSNNDTFPDNLQQLMDGGHIGDLTIKDRQLFYVKGHKPVDFTKINRNNSADANKIILYTSPDKKGEVIYAKVNGSVKAVNELELKKMLADQ